MQKKNNKHYKLSSSLAMITCFASPLWAQLNSTSTDSMSPAAETTASVSQTNPSENNVQVRSLALKKQPKASSHTSSNDTTTHGE